MLVASPGRVQQAPSATTGGDARLQHGGAEDEMATTTTTAEEKLTQLRQLVLNARSMPMSASCVVNRGEVLDAIDDVIAHLPDEIAGAQEVIDEKQSAIAEGEAEADRIRQKARERA